MEPEVPEKDERTSMDQESPAPFKSLNGLMPNYSNKNSESAKQITNSPRKADGNNTAVRDISTEKFSVKNSNKSRQRIDRAHSNPSNDYKSQSLSNLNLNKKKSSKNVIKCHA